MNSLEKNSRFKAKVQLLGSLISSGYLRDIRLFKAFMEVPLEKFIPEPFLKTARVYDDIPNIFYFQNPENYRTISAPHMISIMIQGLALQKKDDLLILGAKSGYIAALALKLAPEGKILILEANADIAKLTMENIKKMGLEKSVDVVVKNPLEGMPERMPWKKILVTGAIAQERIQPLLKQLDPNEGVLFAPIGEDLVQTYTQILRVENDFFGKKQLQVRFTPLMTQVELDELELLTDLDEIVVKDDPKKVDETLSRASRKQDKVNVQYATDVLDDMELDNLDFKEFGAEIKEQDLIVAFLETFIQTLLNLKDKLSIENSKNCIENSETQFEIIKNFEKDFNLDLKKIQTSLDQIKSYNDVRNELERKSKSDPSAREEQEKIISKELEEIATLREHIEKQIKKLKKP